MRTIWGLELGAGALDLVRPPGRGEKPVSSNRARPAGSRLGAVGASHDIAVLLSSAAEPFPSPY